jgi:acetyl esterase/lipase
MRNARLIAALGIVLSPLLFAAPEKSLVAKPDRVIEYKHPEGKPLSLHVFLPPAWKASDKRPVAVFFFGGGWVGGSPTQFYPQAAHFASRGMVGISAEYRTKGSHGTSPKECVEDGKSAVRWVRGHAAELGIDPLRIAAGGGSAGGHVAAAGTFCPGFDGPGEDTGISAGANALLLFNPVFDNGPDGGWNQKAVAGYWEKISPAHNIRKPAPPAVVFLGTKDKLIPVSTAARFKRKMEEMGGRCDLHLYQDCGHGFFNKEPDLTKTTAEADAFLVSLGWLGK